jgi:diguanylate cyclase (GGDEF)-like protein/PAS domain S-box-containing protein
LESEEADSTEASQSPKEGRPNDSRLLTVAMETAANAIFITDRAGRIEYVNPAFERLTGYSAGQALGKTPRLLKSGRQDAELYRVLWETILAGKAWQGRVVNRRRDGELFTVNQTVTPIRDGSGRISHFVAIHEDVTAMVEAEQRLQHMARYDFLTDLPNRYTLNERLAHEVQRSSRSGGRLAVLLLDLDHFKSVNDNYGHEAGDRLLIQVGRRLREAARASDTLARLGGDEFALLQADVHEPEGTADLALRLIRCVTPAFELGALRIFSSVSIGIAVSRGSGADPAELVRQADLALYRAKEEGRNCFRFFEASMNDEIQGRMALGQDLHHALARSELYLEYQPQVDLRSRRLVGVEALLRWRHPQRGNVGPAEFIPIAESNGLIVPIGEWVLRTACAQARAWQRQGLTPIPVAVNLSGVQLKARDFVERVLAVLDETALPARFLELELTETILMNASESLDRHLETLSRRGVRISLDDFGRAYSSLEYLRRFPLNKLKIDQAFVREVGTNHRDATILSAVIALAGKLQLDVIAEGVEPGNQVDFLLSEGCREAQGFYFARPLPPEAIARLLAGGSDLIQPPATSV